MFIKLTNGTPTPYTIGQLRKDNPNVSFPKDIPTATLASYDVYSYTVEDKPDFDVMTQKVVEGGFAEVDGEWKQVWSVVALTDDEAATVKQQSIRSYERAVQKHLDDEARSRGYDGILSACTYAQSTINRFKAEGVVAVAWRDACWNECYDVLAEVEAGTRATPTVEELLQELPSVVWP